MTLNEWTQTPEYRDASTAARIAYESACKGEVAAPALAASAAALYQAALAVK